MNAIIILMTVFKSFKYTKLTLEQVTKLAASLHRVH